MALTFPLMLIKLFLYPARRICYWIVSHIHQTRKLTDTNITYGNKRYYTRRQLLFIYLFILCMLDTRCLGLGRKYWDIAGTQIFACKIAFPLFVCRWCLRRRRRYCCYWCCFLLFFSFLFSFISFFFSLVLCQLQIFPVICMIYVIFLQSQ